MPICFYSKLKQTGNLEDLVKSLKSDSHLIAEGSPFHPGLEVANLFYRWKARSVGFRLLDDDKLFSP